MSETASELHAQLAHHRHHVARVGYPAELRRRVSAYVRIHRKNNIPWSVLSDELGVSGTTLRHWLSDDDRTLVPTFLPVHINEQQPKEATFTMRSPSGWTIDGLSINDLALIIAGRAS